MQKHTLNRWTIRRSGYRGQKLKYWTGRVTEEKLAELTDSNEVKSLQKHVLNRWTRRRSGYRGQKLKYWTGRVTEGKLAELTVMR